MPTRRHCKLLINPESTNLFIHDGLFLQPLLINAHEAAVHFLPSLHSLPLPSPPLPSGNNTGLSIGLVEAIPLVPKSLVLLAAAKRFLKQNKPHAVVLP